MFVMRTVFLVIIILFATHSHLSAEKSSSGGRNTKDRLGFFHQAHRYNDVIARGAFVVDFPDADRFAVFYIPSRASLENVMILLHGSGGTAYDEVADEIDMADKYGYAVIGIQWLDKRSGAYDTARKINGIIDRSLRFIKKEYGVTPGRLALCGFSRGSAVSYEVAYLCKNAVRKIDLVIAHSGGIPYDNVVAPGEGDRPGKFYSELTSGRLGPECLSGINFFLYAGEKDEEWGRTMAGYMRYTADVIGKNGGTVVRLIIDPDGRHAGYRLNEEYHKDAVLYFLGRK